MGGNILSGEKLSLQGKVEANDIAAVGDITDEISGSGFYLNLKAKSVLAGNSVKIVNSSSILNLSGSNGAAILTGANYRNSSNRILDYLKDNKDRGNLTFKGNILKTNKKNVIINSVPKESPTYPKDSRSDIKDNLYLWRGEHKEDAEGNNYKAVFSSANKLWYDLIQAVEKGGIDSKNNISWVVNLWGIENNLDSDKLRTGFVETEKDDLYYKKENENVMVTHGLKYLVNDDSLLIRQEILKWLGGPRSSFNTNITERGKFIEEYQNGIPHPTNSKGACVLPEVRIPQNAVLTRPDFFSSIQQIDEMNFKILDSGRFIINDAGSNYTINQIEIPKEANLHFDTKSSYNSNYDIIISAGDRIGGGPIYFPWNIVIDYDVPKDEVLDNISYVRFFIDGNNDFIFKHDSSEHIGIHPSGGNDANPMAMVDGKTIDLIPEFYLFSLEEPSLHPKKISIKGNYDFQGFIIAPNTYIDFEGASVNNSDENQIFKGMMLCKDVIFTASQGVVFNHYKPLSFNKALASDVLVMPPKLEDYQ